MEEYHGVSKNQGVGAGLPDLSGSVSLCPFKTEYGLAWSRSDRACCRHRITALESWSLAVFPFREEVQNV